MYAYTQTHTHTHIGTHITLRFYVLDMYIHVTHVQRRISIFTIRVSCI